jgi:tetratricopeptide (TPR) repeat protein
MNLDRLIAEASQLIEKKQDTKARQILEKVVKKEPYHSYAVYTLANLYQKEGRLSEAIVVCERFCQKFPNNLEIVLLLTALLDKTQGAETALRLLDKSQLPSDHPDVLRWKCYLLQRTGRWLESESIALRVIERYPNDTYSLGRLISIQYETGNYLEALTLVNRLLKIFPDTSFFYFIRAAIHQKLDPFSKDGKAIADYARGLELHLGSDPLDERDPAVLSLIATAYHATGEHSLAIEMLEKALKNDPQNADTLLVLAAAQAALAHWSAAESSLRKAMELNSQLLGDPYALILSAEIFRRTGQDQKVAEVVKYLLQQFPECHENLIERGFLRSE